MAYANLDYNDPLFEMCRQMQKDYEESHGDGFNFFNQKTLPAAKQPHLLSSKEESLKEEQRQLAIKNIHPSDLCNSCKMSKMITHDEGRVCTGCGIIDHNPISFEPEWRLYSNDTRGTDPVRCGPPTNPLMPRSSLSTSIMDKGDLKSKKLQKAQRWTLDSKEQLIKKTYDQLHNITRDKGIPRNIIESSFVLFQKIINCKRVCEVDIDTNQICQLGPELSEICHKYHKYNNYCYCGNNCDLESHSTDLVVYNSINSSTKNPTSSTNATTNDSNDQTNNFKCSKHVTGLCFKHHTRFTELISQYRMIKKRNVKDKLNHILAKIARLYENEHHDVCSAVRPNAPRGQVRKGLMAACLLHYCKLNPVLNFSPDVIGKIFGLSNEKFTKCINLLNQLMRSNKIGGTIKPTQPSDLIPRYCKNLGFSHHVERIANRIAPIIKESICPEAVPRTIAAGSIVLVCKSFGEDDKCAPDILRECCDGISDLTINKFLNVVSNKKELIIRQLKPDYSPNDAFDVKDFQEVIKERTFLEQLEASVIIATDYINDDQYIKAAVSFMKNTRSHPDAKSSEELTNACIKLIESIKTLKSDTHNKQAIELIKNIIIHQTGEWPSPKKRKIKRKKVSKKTNNNK